MTGFNHFNASGEAHMVDVGNKASTRRVAVAAGAIYMQAETLSQILDGSAKKGDVIGVARLAAIQATKRTSDLIPLCHPLALTHVSVDIEPDRPSNALHIRVRAETQGQTGVEMEALTGVTVGLLTVYDMCKAVDRGMSIGEIRLLEKQGGASGAWKST